MEGLGLVSFDTPCGYATILFQPPNASQSTIPHNEDNNMAKHRSHHNRRSRVFWEVYWLENGRQKLVQETSYSEVIKRMGRLVQNPQVRQSGFRQLQR